MSILPTAICDKLNLDKLQSIENNLELYEKVALFFVLQSYETAASKELKEIEEEDKVNRLTNKLKNWAFNYGENWKEALIEALVIIEAYSEIIQVGIDLKTARYDFQSDAIEYTKHIHLVNKKLYAVCKKMTKYDSEELIDNILKDDDAILVVNNDYKYTSLEVFFQNLLGENIISLGIWPLCSSNLSRINPYCNFQIIIKYMENKYADLKQALESHEIKVNEYLKENYIDDTSNTLYFNSIDYNQDHSEFYQIKPADKVGFFLIFNNKTFYPGKFSDLKDRIGSDGDVKKLQECWSLYGFNVKVFNDKNSQEILNTINEYAKNTNEQNLSVFGICILTHRHGDDLFGSDCESININDIEETMYDLTSKPKILIIQACVVNLKCKPASKDVHYRSESTVDSNYDDSILIRSDSKCDKQDYEINANKSDLITITSSLMDSAGEEDIGTWFIHALCYCVNRYGNCEDILKIFNYIIKTVADRKPTPSIKSTLTKKLKLTKRL